VTPTTIARNRSESRMFASLYQKARGENYNANGDSQPEEETAATAALRFASSSFPWPASMGTRIDIPRNTPARANSPSVSTNSAVFQAPVSTVLAVAAPGWIGSWPVPPHEHARTDVLCITEYTHQTAWTSMSEPAR